MKRVSVHPLMTLLLCTATSAAYAGTGLGRPNVQDDLHLRAAKNVTVRVLTFNVWGIPWITPNRRARMQNIGPAVAELRPDLVSLQEVWMDDDADQLTADLTKMGLSHVQRFRGRNGLLVASRFPIKDVSFDAYRQGRTPHTLWHLDWIAGKGMARVTVDTAVGPLTFAATHMQARYGTDDYLFVQLSQVLQAADALRGASGRPLIVAGDLNSAWNKLPFRMFNMQAGLTATEPKPGIDSVLFRSSNSVEVKRFNAKTVLNTPVAGVGRLSDHDGVLAELVFARCETCAAPAPGQDHLKALAAEAQPLIHKEIERLEVAQLVHIVTSGLLALLATVMMIRRWRRSPQPPKNAVSRRWSMRLAASAFVTVLLSASLWFGYLGTVYGPAHLENVIALKQRLSE